MTAQAAKVILSYGMGVDSTAILLRWLCDPSSRDFDLSDLVVVTAMTGNEYASTADLVTRHILPRLKAAGVRFVQVARGGLYEAAGAIKLDDTREPAELHFDGRYALADEWRENATLQCSGGVRRCSLKFKGWVIDTVLREQILEAGAGFRHVIGFNAEETSRVAKDQVYGALEGRTPSYPLLEWGWGRAECEAYIEGVVGESWRKSACVFCPFGQGCERLETQSRWPEEPGRAAWAVEVERVAMAFNPRMKLYKTKGAEEIMESIGLDEPIRIADERLASTSWAVYRMRRGQLPVDGLTASERKAGVAPRWDLAKRGQQQRSIKAITARTLTRAEARAKLAAMAAEAGLEVEGDRCILRDTGEGYPRIEEYLVAAPSYVHDKHSSYKGADAEARFEAFLGRVEALVAAPPPAPAAPARRPRATARRRTTSRKGSAGGQR